MRLIKNSFSILLLLASCLTLRAGGAQTTAAGSWNPLNYKTRLGIQCAYETLYTNSITLNGLGASVWADRSGNGNHLTNGVAANQMVLTNSTIGPVLYSDGVNDFLKSAAIPALVQPTTVFLGVKQVTWTENDHLFDGNSLTERGALRQQTQPNLSLWSGTSLSPSHPGSVVGMFQLWAAGFNGAASWIRLNAGTPVIGSPGTHNMRGITLGALANVAAFSNIEVSSVYVTAGKTNTPSEIVYIDHGPLKRMGLK